jgi:tetratricopeptide (TPR) repeat protein
MVSPQDRLTFAESHLSVSPLDKPLLQGYLQAAAASQQLERAHKFLASGLDDAPVRVEWHRAAQHLSTSDDELASLRARYERWLQKEPNNSAILYLLGRLEPRRDAAASCFDRAIAADPANPYPWLAKGFQMELSGDFADAKSAYQKAADLQPADYDFQLRLQNIRFALGEYPALEHEIMEAQKHSPLNLELHLRLLDVLAAQDKLAQARYFNDEYLKQLAAQGTNSENERFAARAAQCRMLYLDKSFTELLAQSQEPELASSAANLRYQCHLELGQYADAAADLESGAGQRDPTDLVRLSIGWRMAGDEPRATECRTKACERLDAGLPDGRQIAAILRAGADAKWEDIESLSIEPERKATLLIALAQQSPARQDQLLALAEKLNYARLFPRHFHERAIAALREKN